MFIRKEPKKVSERTTVEFLDPEEIKLIASPLSAQAYDTFDNLIDRYVDAKMKEVIISKINETPYDENTEVKLKGLLEFKKFLGSFKA